MSFKTAIEKTELLKDAFKDGLKALGSDSSKIKPSNTRKCEGSVDIDTAVKSIYPNDSRWDYAFGYDGETYFIEVHSTKTDEVKSVINKHRWLKDFLARDAPELNKEKKNFYWIASSGNNKILPHSSQQRKLIASGIQLVRQLNLP